MTSEERFDRIEESLATVAISMARASERMDRFDERMDGFDERMARIDGRLDRAVRLSIREARSERLKRRELDDKLTQLAAAQLVTEEKLQGLIEALKRGGNGHA